MKRLDHCSSYIFFQERPCTLQLVANLKTDLSNRVRILVGETNGGGNGDDPMTRPILSLALRG